MRVSWGGAPARACAFGGGAVSGRGWSVSCCQARLELGPNSPPPPTLHFPPHPPQENIILGDSFDPDRYRMAVEVSQLVADLEML
jgi:hypothetical protein